MFQQLIADLEHTGFYPAVMRHTLAESLGDAPVRSYLTHLNTHFDYDDIQRHLTVLVLTDKALVAAHMHDFEDGGLHAQVAQESVALSCISTVTVTTVFKDPQHFTENTPVQETILRLTWAGSHRINLMLVECPDPECIADHGLTGDSSPEDLTIRVAADADGQQAVDHALVFSRALRDAVFAQR